MYTALYRQWRPDTFEEVVGQDAIVRTLKNQIQTERIAHAYLFCGSRGTGKTSTAKIFARAINCSGPVNGSPCGECAVCVQLSSGSSMDVIEIDAASNNGVDEIRDLRDKVRYPPAAGRFKVYIVDEVHMLSMGAFNALLKTLEEPPAHAVFILATTEPHKLPATILSRCQRFDFKRISSQTMVSRMRDICTRSNILAEEAGLYTIARWAEGGMRDALSLLDQVVGFCGSSVTDADILAVLGTADQGFIFRAADHILQGEAAELLDKLGRLAQDGKDLSVFLKDLIHHLRNLLIVQICGRAEALLDVDAAALDRLEAQAAEGSQTRVLRAMDILTALEADLRYSTQPRVLVELAAVKICRPDRTDSLEDLQDRIETLEQRLAQRNFVNAPVTERPCEDKDNKEMKTEGDASEVKFSARRREPAPKVPTEEPEPSGQQKQHLVEKSPVKDAAATWPEILKTIKKERLPLFTLLGSAKPQWDKSGALVLVFPEDQGFFVSALEKEENRTYLENLVLQHTDKRARIKSVLGNSEPEPEQDRAPEAAADPLAMAIEVFGADAVEVAEED